MKGVVADHFGATEKKREDDGLVRAAFGRRNNSSTIEANSTAGSLVFTDARIVCLPIRSFYGTFAWVTSPFCLERLKRDTGLAVPSVVVKSAIVTDKTKLVRDGTKLYLEDLDLDCTKSKEADGCAELIAGAVFADRPDWQAIFRERLAIVSDDIFTFLCEAGTEVSAHIRIDEDSGTVAGGALWYEEALPVETLLAGTVWCDRVYRSKQDAKGVNGDLTKEKLLENFCSRPLELQIGGKASTGKGQVRCLFESR